MLVIGVSEAGLYTSAGEEHGGGEGGGRILLSVSILYFSPRTSFEQRRSGSIDDRSLVVLNDL